MSRSPGRAVLCLTLAALAACEEKALPPPPSVAPSASASGVASAAGRRGRRVCRVPRRSGAAEPPASSNDSPFSVVARSPDGFELYPLKGALFLDAAGFLALLDDGPLRQSPSVMKGLEHGESGRILGAYPDGAWIAAGAGTLRWTSDRWAENQLLREHERLLDVAAWDDNRAVAAIGMPGNDMRFFLVGGKPGVVLPAPSAADASNAEAPLTPATDPDDGVTAAAAAAEGSGAACKVRMKPAGVVLAGLPGGELYAAGYLCEPGRRGAAIVERWEPKQVRGTVEPLPLPESGHRPEVAGVLARSASEVLVYGREGSAGVPYVARFDGKAWSLDKVPFGGGVDTLAVTDDGTSWAAAGGEVWKKSPTAAWEKVPLPSRLQIHAVRPRTATDVWASGRELEGKARAVLLRSRSSKGAAPAVLHLPPRNAMAGMIATNKRFFATAACDKVYAHLYTLGPSKDASGKAAAVPKDFSALAPVFEGELAGLQPVVEDDGANLYVGVPVPSRDVGRRLLAAYEEKNPKATPNLFCHEPVMVRQAIVLGGKRP